MQDHAADFLPPRQLRRGASATMWCRVDQNGISTPPPMHRTLPKLRVGPVCRQSVKNILIEHGLDPGPKRGKETWSDFLRIHAETLWQCDFFSKRIWTLQGPRQIFALAFIHLATRRVFVTPGSFKPDAAWMEAQARAFLDHAAAERLTCETVTRGYDGMFSNVLP